jgi:hypothetical protein
LCLQFYFSEIFSALFLLQIADFGNLLAYIYLFSKMTTWFRPDLFVEKETFFPLLCEKEKKTNETLEFAFNFQLNAYLCRASACDARQPLAVQVRRG